MKKILYCFFILTVCALTAPTLSFAQNTDITGHVADEKNTPVFGASVIVKGAPSIGTTTSESGAFKLSVPSTADSLIISVVGYETVTVAISNNPINIQLEAIDASLNDVVVVVFITRSAKGAITEVETLLSEIPFGLSLKIIDGKMNWEIL